MDRLDCIERQAVEICYALFGVDYHTLEVRSWPRLASYHCAKRMVEDNEDNIFRTLGELADRVHNYNKRIKGWAVGDGAGEGEDEIRDTIANRGLLLSDGGSDYERVTGNRPPGPAQGNTRKQGRA